MDGAAQMQLDDRMVKGFVAVQKELARFDIMPGSEPDPRMMAQIEAVATKHGFPSFADFEDVAYNVTLVLGGLDPQTGNFGDPSTALRNEIAALTADPSVPASEKRQLLEEMRQAVSTMPKTLDFPGNVDVVMRHFDDIQQLAQ